MAKNLEYKDERGNTLYGFSQTGLDRTNAKLNDVTLALKILIILSIVFLISAVLFIGWLAYHDVLTRLIYEF